MYSKSGFVLLLSVLIVGAVGLSVASTFLLLGVDSSRTSLDFIRSKQARSLADACAEEALEKIWESTVYSGSGNLTFGAGTCAYTVIDLGGSNRQINASGTVSNIVRRVKILINQVNPTIGISSWQEVADF